MFSYQLENIFHAVSVIGISKMPYWYNTSHGVKISFC